MLLGFPNLRYIRQDSPSKSRLWSCPSIGGNPWCCGHGCGGCNNIFSYFSLSMGPSLVEVDVDILDPQFPSRSRLEEWIRGCGCYVIEVGSSALGSLVVKRTHLHSELCGAPRKSISCSEFFLPWLAEATTQASSICTYLWACIRRLAVLRNILLWENIRCLI